MRSSSGAFNYSLRTIPPLVSFADYISEYLFAAASRSSHPTPLPALPYLSAHPLSTPPFGCHDSPQATATAPVSSSSSSSSIVGLSTRSDAAASTTTSLVQESLILGPRNTPLLALPIYLIEVRSPRLPLEEMQAVSKPRTS